jgi:Outer membrane protein beta-barrel domain
MRRLTLPLVAALLIAAAHSAPAQQLTWGVRGGLNLATADVGGSLFAQDVGGRTGFHAGILGIVDISENFALETDVLYSQKGFGTGDGDVSLSLNYFEIPVMAVIRIPGSVSPHLYLGVELSLESGCTVSSGALQDVSCDDIRAENARVPRTKGADSGLMFGAGVTVDVGFTSLLIDVLYDYGLTDISEPTEEIDSIKTRTLLLSVGATWPIGSTGG